MATRLSLNSGKVILTQKDDGTWWRDGKRVSNERMLKTFGNKKLTRNKKTGQLDYSRSKSTQEERDHEFGSPGSYTGDGAYDAQGNPRVRDYNKQPLTNSEKTANEMEDMMGDMRSKFGKEDDFFTGKGHWQPSPLFVPPVQALQGMSGRPRWEDIQGAQLDRGSGFKPEHYRGEESYSTPIDQMSPPAYQPDRRQPSYNGESSGLRQLSPEEIDYMNNAYSEDSKINNPPVRLELERTVPRSRNIWDYLNSLKRNVQ